MKEKYMQFGEYIKQKRKSKEYTITQVAEYLGVSRAFLCDVENKRRAPFDGEKMELFSEFLHLSEKETALLFDLASQYNRNVPYDIAEIFMHKEVGELARIALRLSKECNEPEAKWKQLIRELESTKTQNTNNTDNALIKEEDE